MLQRRAAHPAVVWRERSYSFEEIRGWASAYAARLASLGIRRGDRVAVFAETCPEVIAAFVGHLMSGVVHVPFNTRYKADEARHILETRARWRRWRSARKSARRGIREILGMKEVPACGTFSSGGCVRRRGALLFTFENLLFLFSPWRRRRHRHVIYTSGTTGKSKAWPCRIALRTTRRRSPACGGSRRRTRLVLAACCSSTSTALSSASPGCS